MTELYHSAIKAAEDSMQQAQTQLDSVNAQLGAAGLATAAGAFGGLNWLSEGHGFKFNYAWDGMSTITF